MLLIHFILIADQVLVNIFLPKIRNNKFNGDFKSIFRFKAEVWRVS